MVIYRHFARFLVGFERTFLWKFDYLRESTLLYRRNFTNVCMYLGRFGGMKENWEIVCKVGAILKGLGARG